MKDHAPLPFCQTLPWQQPLINTIFSQLLNDESPKSLLLHALPGMGLWNLAESLAYLALCKHPADNQPCQTCKSCQIIQASMAQSAAQSHPITQLNHPAIWQIENTQNPIGIDIIREMIEKLQIQQHKQHLIIIGLIENLNEHTYNTLLKTTEEPRSGQQFILLTHQISQVPATIQSRCQKFYLSPNDSETTLDYLIKHEKLDKQSAQTHLAQTQGRPLLGLKQHAMQAKWKNHLNKIFNNKQNAFQNNNQWLSEDIGALLDQWVIIIDQLIKKYHNQAHYRRLIEKIDDFLIDLYKIKQQRSNTPSSNKLILNTLLLQWSTLKQTTPYNPIFLHAT